MVAGLQMHLERMNFMGHAQDHIAACGENVGKCLQIVFPGDPLAVRGALKTAMEFLRQLEISQDECGPVELVMAEAINNVIEHAYEGGSHGIVELSIEYRAGALLFVILDDGLPMPDGDAPTGHKHDLTCEVEDLPEGGFGWFLIRELTQDLRYTRTGSRNRLEFNIIPGIVGKA